MKSENKNRLNKYAIIGIIAIALLATGTIYANGATVQASPAISKKTCSNYGYAQLEYGLTFFCATNPNGFNQSNWIWATAIYGSSKASPAAVKQLAVAYVPTHQNVGYVAIIPNSERIICMYTSNTKQCLDINFGQQGGQGNQYYVWVFLNGYQYNMTNTTK